MLKLTRTNVVALPVKLRLPTETAGKFLEGSITVRVKVLTKEEIAALSEKGTTDAEYIDQLVTSVEGLGDAEDNPLTGDAALAEVKSGLWSAFLQSAIIQAYFDQFGEARVKNSKPSRGN